jgi:hypothetical protein
MLKYGMDKIWRAISFTKATLSIVVLVLRIYWILVFMCFYSGVWRYHRSNQNRKSEKNREHIGQKTEEQRTHWPKEKGQTDKQRSTKHTLLLKTLNMLFLARIYQHGNFMEEIKEVRNSKQIVFRMGFVPTWTLTKLDRLCSTFAHIMIFFCSIIEVWCLGSWFGLLQFVVFKMGLHINIRVHIPQALNFKWDFHVFIVTSEVQTIKHFGDLLP